jgi:phosphatidylserine/phosphatidylglycerophosphate/cardiolipin synthase-like enzyme
MDNQEVQQIEDAGITIIGDQHEGLMHNKFVVIDRTDVWTGSMNFTTNGAYEDNNNLIHIHSTQAAEEYTVVFDEMFKDNLFGMDARPEGPTSLLTIAGTPVEIYFSPEGGVAAQILSLINSAHESIYFMAYTFTSNELGDAVRQRAADGLTVAGVMDADQIDYSQGTEFDAFKQAGLDVRRDGNDDGLMHHKVFIIDRSIVITGSYNFTASAETRNDENIVIIHNTEMAAKYLDEFQRVYDLGKP